MFLSYCSTCTVILLVVIYKLLDWVIRRLYIGNYTQRYILVTGCDTGFGNLAAKRLDTLGCHVFAGCLTETGETELRKTCSNRLQTISLDVSKPDSVRHAYETVKQALPKGKGLWGVVNNAGILGPFGPPEWAALKNYQSVCAVNLFGMIDVTMTFLPLVKKERGRIVNTSSICGRLSVPTLVPYCVSKHGVEAFTDGLRRAMHPFGVKPSIIEPGGFNTTLVVTVGNLIRNTWKEAPAEGREKYGKEYCEKLIEGTEHLLKTTYSDRLDLVVDAYVHGLLGRYPRARYVVGTDAQLIALPITWLPEWLADWVWSKLVPLPSSGFPGEEQK